MARVVALSVLKAESGLSHHLDNIRQFPMLEPQKEYMLARSWREHGDREAAHKLVTSHLRLVAKIAMGYRGYGLPISEVASEGNVGLMQAVILAAKDHAEAFLMVETDRAAAFVMDDILLFSLVVTSKSPADYTINADALSVEPYGIMLRREDPAFKKLVDGAMTAVYKSGEINAIYEKWFQKPIPPKGVNLNLPMGASFKKVVANPTNSGDPAVYQ
jgi:hypothetical protein